MIIDDEPELVDLVKDWLESKEYEVISANDGAEGLRKAKDDEPSLIILDVKMPGMDGFEVLNELRNEPKTQYTPVIMLTQKRETKSIVKAAKMGSTDYIMKPFSVQELLNMVKRYDWYKG